jgi:hypothetical protein
MQAAAEAPMTTIGPLETRAEAIRRYIETGQYDPQHSAWPGNLFESGRAATADLTRALVSEVQRRSERREEGRAAFVPLSCEELKRFSRTKLEPMVCGLFPRTERDACEPLPRKHRRRATRQGCACVVGLSEETT